MRTCQSCGTALAAGLESCHHCGVRVVVEVGDETVAMVAAASAPRTPPNPSGSSVLRFHTAATEDEGRFLPGTLIAGRYRMIELLGRGGMGEVYRATDLTLAQSVALKFLPDAADNQRLIERFHNEVRIARQVSHPNVCRVYDIGEAEGMPFLSMEYVDGEDLGSLLQRIGRLPNDKALDITRRICAVVAAAHERGIIHRDLKPQNIMLNRRGEVVIMDFGLAAIADELRGAEARNGTPAYMSPEQLRGDVVTAKSDIYALGLIIYEIFTGKRAFEANTLADLIAQQESRTPVSVTSLVSDADPAVEKVILRCLDPDPSRRPATALQVSAALPGGDPLAAALAAGEMPSPELVARSGKAEGIAAKYAIGCLIFVVGMLLVQPFLMWDGAMATLAPPPYPAAVLEQKAVEMVATLGHHPPVGDRESEFSVKASYFDHARPKTKRDWSAFLKAESPYHFNYRQSPTPMLSPPDGEITMDRPALNVPGMVSLSLDGNGKLRMFQAVIAGTDQPQSPVDPSVVFNAAGLDISRFDPLPPKRAPALAFDDRKAWKGKHPHLPDTELTVELATWRGLPVSFEIITPWSEEHTPASTRNRAWFLSVLSGLLFFVGLFYAIYFARQNLKRGRGDRHGAFLLASAIAGLRIAYFFLRAHYVPDGAMFNYIFTNVAWSLTVGLLVWLAYIALEPMVRATWPQSLITWNRVLAGRIGDPLVASQILIGATAGMLVCLVFDARVNWTLQHGGDPKWLPENLYQGPAAFIAAYVSTLNGALTTSLIIFFILCGLKAVLRLDWAAALAASLLLSLEEGSLKTSSSFGFDIALYVLIFALFAFMLLRMGLVPSIAGIVFINLAGRIEVAPEFLNWINAIAVVELLIPIAIALFAFWRSQSSPTVEAP